VSILTTTLWLSVALYLARKLEPVIDATFSIAWNHVLLPGVKLLVPKPSSRTYQLVSWVWWQITRTK
jgi:hypothetical protein